MHAKKTGRHQPKGGGVGEGGASSNSGCEGSASSDSGRVGGASNRSGSGGAASCGGGLRNTEERRREAPPVMRRVIQPLPSPPIPSPPRAAGTVGAAGRA